MTNPSTVHPVSSARLTAVAAALAAGLAFSAQSPAPASSPLAWCTRIPIPRVPECRPLEVHAPKGTLRLAVANTEPQRQHGLMNVPYVPLGQGMIFVFADGDADRGFWMKDTITPLDMVFVRRDGSVSSVEVNVPATPPKTPDEKVARRNGAGQYVIELGAGQAGQFGLLPGSRVVIPPLAAQ